MTLPNTASLGRSTPSTHFSRSVYECLQNSHFVQALIHICKPLIGMLRLLIAGMPASLGGGLSISRTPVTVADIPPSSPKKARAENEPDGTANGLSGALDEQSVSGDSASTGDSVSIADAIRFRLIHYEAAEKVAREIGKKMRQKEDLHKAEPLDDLAVLIERSAASLREKQLDRISNGRPPMKQDIGGRRKRGKVLDFFCSFSGEQKALVQAGLNGAEIPEKTRHVHIRTALASVIHGKLRGLGCRDADYSIDAIEKQIFDKYVETLNAKPWNDISRGHALQFPDQDSGVL